MAQIAHLHPEAAGRVPADRGEMGAVALKAYRRIVDAWALTNVDAAALADMSTATWKRAKQDGWTGELTHDQLLRLSAVIGIYKALELYFSAPLSRDWVRGENTGPEFLGRRPVDAMIAGGLPKIIAVRGYLDALRGGA